MHRVEACRRNGHRLHRRGHCLLFDENDKACHSVTVGGVVRIFQSDGVVARRNSRQRGYGREPVSCKQVIYLFDEEQRILVLLIGRLGVMADGEVPKLDNVRVRERQLEPNLVGDVGRRPNGTFEVPVVKRLGGAEEEHVAWVSVFDQHRHCREA